MLYQEDLREGQVVALWAGEMACEGDLNEYLGRPFETKFGFHLDPDDLPEFSRVFSEPRLHAHYNRPFIVAGIRQLLTAFTGADEWKDEAERVCRQKGIYFARIVVAFPNLRYRPELEHAGKAAPGPFQRMFQSLGFSRTQGGNLHFIGNFSWPGGAKDWATLQSNRIIMPPFPKLIVQSTKREVGNTKDRCVMTQLSWDGVAHLESWKRFAADVERSEDEEWRFAAWPDGDFALDVSPPGGSIDRLEPTSEIRPTEAQARAFGHLLDNQAAIRDAVFGAIFKDYPEWRQNYFGEQISSDGGKTYKTGWDLPEMFPPGDMPEIKSPDELLKLIQLSTIHVLETDVDGFVRIGFAFGCKWDDEHGLGVLTHKGKVIEVGQGDSAFNDAASVIRD